MGGWAVYLFRKMQAWVGCVFETQACMSVCVFVCVCVRV